MTRYDELAPKVQELKRQGKNEDALILLDHWMAATERESQRDQIPVESWPYWQACVVLRKLKRYGDEASVIERFLGQPSSGSKQSQELVDRLSKAYHLAGLTEARDQNGQSIVIYKPEGIPLDERSLFVREAILLDTETTGLSRTDEVIELALLRFRYSHYSGRILEVKDSYVGRREPGCAISPQATKLHGIKKADVAGRQLDFGRVRALLDGASMVLAHNASFDQRMATKLLPELDRLPWYCTMNGIDWLDKGCGSRKLEDICAVFGVTYGAHRADADVHALLELLAVVDPRTASPLLHEMVRSVPLGYVSTWKMQQEADEEDDEEYEEDDYGDSMVITLSFHPDVARSVAPTQHSARAPSTWRAPDEPGPRQPVEPLLGWGDAPPKPAAAKPSPSRARYLGLGLLATAITVLAVGGLVAFLMSLF